MDYAELIDRNLTNHTPSTEAGDEMTDLRRHFHALGTAMLAALPEGREKSLAITQLEQASMWSMAALARADFDRLSHTMLVLDDGPADQVDASEGDW